MKRVEVTRFMLGLFYMQVCACKDATDEEILEAANRENPAGTSSGWGRVIRTVEDDVDHNKLPVQCSQYPETRLHFLLVC